MGRLAMHTLCVAVQKKQFAKALLCMPILRPLLQELDCFIVLHQDHPLGDSRAFYNQLCVQKALSSMPEQAFC